MYGRRFCGTPVRVTVSSNLSALLIKVLIVAIVCFIIGLFIMAYKRHHYHNVLKDEHIVQALHHPRWVWERGVVFSSGKFVLQLAATTQESGPCFLVYIGDLLVLLC